MTAAIASASLIAVPAVAARPRGAPSPRLIALGLLALIGALAVLGEGFAGPCAGPGLDVAAIELPKVAPAA